MKARVDDDRCRGHGMCVTLCPSVFEVTDDGYARVLLTEVPSEFEDAVSRAVNQCPEHAISIEE
jgi:ferredoxin